MNKPHKHTKADKIIIINTVREFVLLGKQKEGKVLICHLQHKAYDSLKESSKKKKGHSAINKLVIQKYTINIHKPKAKTQSEFQEVGPLDA